MSQKQLAPAMQGTKQGQIQSIVVGRLHLHNQDKGIKNLLTPAQRKVYNLLMDGGMYSTADISTKLMICDPRSAIRHIRRSGVEVSDTWVMGEFGVRFKRYFIKQIEG